LLEEQARTDCRGRGSLSLSLSLSLAGGNPTNESADASARESSEQASGEKRFRVQRQFRKVSRARRKSEREGARAPKGSAGTGEGSSDGTCRAGKREPRFRASPAATHPAVRRHYVCIARCSPLGEFERADVR
jgi:hypothetical protein